MKKRYYLYILCFIFIFPMCFAKTQTVVNSNDWIDVYSAMLYSKLGDTDSNFVIDKGHGVELIGLLDKQANDIFLINSKNNPYIIGYDNLISNAGFSVSEFTSKDPYQTNLNLAKKSEVRSFILIDSAYAYNAVSVAPYATLTDSFVLFADRKNINDVSSFLQTIDNPKIIIYGHVDSKVKESMSNYNPEIISSGDKYKDNIEIAKKFLDIKKTKQVIFSNGDFIEKSVFYGDNPIIFIGKTNVPDDIVDFVKSNDLEVGVLVGNDLFANAKLIKERTGLKIFIKYAKGIDSTQKALDMLFLPQNYLDIHINSLNYNKVTKKIEITYYNAESSKGFFISTHDILLNDKSILTFGDDISIFIDAKELKTIEYDVDLSDYINQELFVSSLLLFGSQQKSLDKASQFKAKLNFIDFKDDSLIDIIDLKYSKNKKRFYIDVTNIGTEDVYVDIDIIDLLIDFRKTTFSSSKEVLIKPGKTEQIPIRVDMTDSDIEDNPKVDIKARYGAREHTLIKATNKQFEMKITSLLIDYALYILLIILVLFFFLFIIFKRRKKDDDEARY